VFFFEIIALFSSRFFEKNQALQMKTTLNSRILFPVFIFFLLVNVVSWGQVTVSSTGGNGTGNGTYTTLGAAFTAIGTSATGAITITISGNTTEAVGGATLGAGTWTSITIAPSGGSWTVSGAATAGTPLIHFNGADNVTINGGGNLTFSNTTASSTNNTCTLQLKSDATNNTFNNVTFLGSSIGLLGSNTGTIFISTATTTGNDNNSFQSCKFGPAGTNLPTQCVMSNGTATTSTKANSNITLNNCEFYDFYTATSSCAINAVSGNTDWTITNNKIYQTAPRSYSGTMYGIYFADATYGNNLQITGNTIGYANASGTGTYTLTGTGNFTGIFFNLLNTSSTASNINNNTISDISYTSSTGNFYGISNQTSTSSSTCTININSNTIRNLTLLSTSGTFYGISAAGASTLSVNSNTINNISRNTGGTLYAILHTTSANVTFNSNLITNISSTSISSTSTIYGIYSGTSAVNETWTNNTINNISSLSTGSQSIYGIYCLTTTGIKTCQGNTISSWTLPSTGTGTMYGISINYAGTTNPISGNNINNLTGGTTIYGLYVSAGTTNNIYNNKIYGLSSSVTTPVVYGIYISGGSTNNVFNNIIGGLTTSASTSSNGLVGLYLNSGTTNNVYYNTVRLSGTSSGTGFGSSAVYASTTPTVNLRNNIFVNTCTSTGSGLSVAYRRSGTTLTSYASTSNSNLFYGSTLFYDGTTAYTTLAAYQTLVGTRDAASKFQNPTFASTTGSDPTFLHFAAGVINQAGGYATNISGYTTDFDGDTRDGTTPDIGADEFVQGVPVAPTITSYTPSILCVQGGQSVTITGTDLDAVTAVAFNGVSGIITAQTSTSLTVTSPANLSSGSIVVTNAVGSATSTAYTTEATPATPTVTGGGTVCSSATLVADNANDGTMYWQNTTSNGTSTATASSSQSVTTSGTYYYRAVSINGCWSVQGSSLVTVNSPISITTQPSNSDQTKCVGTAATALTVVVTGTSPSYQWYSNTSNSNSGGTLISGATSSSYTPLTASGNVGTTYYYCVVTNASPCSSNVTSNVSGAIIVNSLPTISVNSGTYCSGGSGISLSATGGSTYSWSPSTGLSGTSGSTVSASPSATTTYTVTGTNSNNCVSTATSTVTYISSPSSMSIAQSPSSACSGSVATLSLSGGTVNSQFTIGSGASTTSSSGTSSGNNVSPFSHYFGGYKAQYLLKASELTSAGIVAGNLNSLALDITTAGTTYTGFTLSLGQTSSSSLSTTFLSPTFTQVYTGNLNVSSTGTLTLSFGTGSGSNSTFTWDGTSNIVVNLCWSNNNAGGTAAEVKYDATSYAALAYYRVDSNSPSSVCSASTATGTLLFRPKITFGQVASITYVWSPSTNLYTNAAATTAYSGGSATTVYALNNSATSYTVTATNNTCTSSASVTTSINPLPAITLGTADAVCLGTTSSTLSYTATTGSPNQFIIDYDATANAQGFVDISTYTSFSSSPISLAIPANATAGTYNATLTVKNSTTGCVSTTYSFTVTLNSPPNITSQPSNSIVLPGADATFTVSATGTGLSYQWQVSTDNGATWTNASGTSTNASYTESAVASGSTGNQYRCIVSGTAPCSSQTSNAATLTVSSTAIAAHPQDQVICSSSGTASFSVTTTGSTPTYQWQVSTDGGSTWSDISGETNSSLSLTGLTVTSNTYKYRCSLNSGSINSNAALLTVYAAPTISAQPTDLTVCSNATSGTITISASGNGSTLSYQWQVSTDGGNNWSNVSGSNVSGATSSTLSFSSFTNSMDGNKYKVVLNTSSPCSTVTSDVVTLSVTGYTVSASASSICLGASFTLTETPTSTAPTLSYSWACATTGSGATVAVTTNPATITPTATGTFTYTLTTTGGSCTLTSTQAITVNANPSITSVTASPSSVCSGSSVSLSAASVSASTGTAVIGSGNTQGANNTTFVRVGNTVGNQFKNQYLFTAAELNAAGLTSGNITSLAFDVFVSGGGTVSNLTFKLGTTSLTNLTSTYVSGLTQVYTVGTYPATGVLQVGLQTVTFNTPFFWDGISNLVLEACSQLATSGTAGDLRSGTTTFVSTITNNPSTTACGSSTGAGTVSVRPNFTFGGQVGTNNAANFSWSWNTTPTLTSATGTTTASNNTNAGVSQVYTATATNASTGCSTSLSATAITINPLPSTPTANGTTICGPQNATCSVTTASSLTGSTYNWYTVPSGGTAISGQTGSSLSTYPVSATTTYYVSELNSGCESGRVAVTQTVSTPPSISTSVSTATICAGQSTSLSSSSSNSGYTYSWNNNGGSGATVSVSPTATTTYTVTGTDVSGGINNGCSATATTTVTVNPVPSAVTISPTSVSICSGSTTQLTGSPALVANVTGYSTNVSTGATLMDVTGGTDLIGQNQDDAASSVTNIGFDFVYEGTTYTQFSVNSNGLIRLGGTVVNTALSNSLASTENNPKIMPLWDDISTGTSGYVRYKVNGSSPNRILVVEHFGRLDATETSASTSKFQTLFYETSNLIEFVYGPSSVTSLSSATIGISGIVNTNYMARKNVNNNNFGASSAAETIATWPGEGTKYTFIPTPTYTWSGGPITSGGSTATATVNPTSTTTYTLTSTNGLGCSVSTTAIVTVNQPTITWTGATSTDPTVASNWNPSGVPCTVSDVTIPSGLTNYPIYSSLTISSGGTYTLQSGAQLTLTGALTNNGTMTIESGATFKQGTSVTGTGTYNVKQTIDNGAGSGTTLSGRFWYLGSPLACTRSSSFGTSGSLNKVWEFTNGAYANVADNASLDPTKGYVHRRSDASQTLTFSGQNLYAQDVTLSLSNNAGTYAGWHLVSNPYTAYLDWSAVVNSTSTQNMSNTYYIRSYNSNSQDVDALISYNASSGLESNTSSFSLGSTGSTTAQYIAPLQAFWVKVPPTSTLSSTAGALRLERAFTSHQTGTLKNTGVYPVLARVNLYNGDKYDQALVYMNEFMTNASDQNDSEKMFVSGVASIYFMASGKKLVMNGLKNNKKKISVPLYLELPTSKVYQLQLSEYIMEDGLILLEDKQEGTIQDFTIHDVYSFYANSGVLSNRFVLHFYMPDAGVSAQGPSNSWVEEESAINEGGSILVSSNGRGKVTITQDIDATPTEKGSVVVRDAAGREIYNGQLTGSATNLELDAPSGIYFVSVELNGQVEVKKIFVQQ
jgi:hypothetical protein